MKKLPILESFPETPRDSFDNSMLEAHKQCPRYYWIRYELNRAPHEKSFPIVFGNAYHKYREVLDLAYLAVEEVNPEYHELALEAAFQIFGKEESADPPLDHKHSFLTRARLLETCEQAFSYWTAEKNEGTYVTMEAEQSFQVPLPSGALYGGKIDNIFRWSTDLWIKDYKTTSRMGRTYAYQFEPNAQFTGYIWGVRALSGRFVKGVMVETVYNTKNIGPQHSNFLSTRTEGAIEEWIEDTEATIADVLRDRERRYFPKRTSACMNYGGCYFREFCKLGNWNSREAWLEGHTEARTWDFLSKEESDANSD